MKCLNSTKHLNKKLDLHYKNYFRAYETFVNLLYEMRFNLDKKPNKEIIGQQSYINFSHKHRCKISNKIL